MRQITFKAADMVSADITISELENGTLRFDVAVAGEGKIGDLRGLYFDLVGYIAGNQLVVEAAPDSGSIISGFTIFEAAVTSVGAGTKVNGEVVKKQGKFDIGVSFGTPGTGRDDLREASFMLVGRRFPSIRSSARISACASPRSGTRSRSTHPSSPGATCWRSRRMPPCRSPFFRTIPTGRTVSYPPSSMTRGCSKRRDRTSCAGW